VIDGSKALRKAIDEVYGKQNPGPRGRSHRLRNVLGCLPKTLQGQVGAVLRAARKLEPKQGRARLRPQLAWLEHSYPKATASLCWKRSVTFARASGTRTCEC